MSVSRRHGPIHERGCGCDLLPVTAELVANGPDHVHDHDHDHVRVSENDHPMEHGTKLARGKLRNVGNQYVHDDGDVHLS